MFELLLNNPRVMVQGITGRHGSFHTGNMLAAGTNIVAGVTPGKGGQQEHNLPVYNTVREAAARHAIDVSVVFVPPAYAPSALIEAIENDIALIVCVTEGIPTLDVLDILNKARQKNITIIGPNCPGVLVPGKVSLGIIPTTVGTPGNVALVSRSGTLTYEAAASLTAAGVGQRYIIGIGGDKLRGTRFADCLAAFEADEQVNSIVLIGEIGGQDEQQAASYIKNHVTKPVFAYVVGHSAPPDVQLGHAGAIMGNNDESAAAKTSALDQAGAQTAKSLPELMAKIIQNR